jgi:pyruvate,orthophosphate dikinase
MKRLKRLARLRDDERFACDSYRRFIQMYSDVVMGVDHEVFEDALGTPRTSAA